MNRKKTDCNNHDNNTDIKYTNIWTDEHIKKKYEHDRQPVHSIRYLTGGYCNLGTGLVHLKKLSQ